MALRIVAMGLALIAGGCASVARGTSEQVAFDTSPSGAEVRVVIPSNRRSPRRAKAKVSRPRRWAALRPARCRSDGLTS